MLSFVKNLMRLFKSERVTQENKKVIVGHGNFLAGGSWKAETKKKWRSRKIKG